MRKLRLIKKLLILLALLFLALLAGAWLYLGSDSFSNRARAWVVAELQSRFELEAEVDSVRVRLWGLVVEVEGFRLFEPGRPADGPAVNLESLTADLSASSLLGSGLQLDRLELQRPVILFRRQPDGRLNLAQMFSSASAGGQPSAPPSLWIGALSINNGLVRYNQRDIPLNFSRFGFQAEISSTSLPGEYSGRLVLDGFELQTGRLSLPPSRIGVEFRADSKQVSHLEASLSSPSLQVVLEGRMGDFQSLSYEFDFEAQGDFEALRSEGFLAPVEQAHFESQGRLSGQGGDFRYQGSFQAPTLSAFGLDFEGLTTRIDLTPRQVEFQSLKARVRQTDLDSSGVLGFAEDVESRLEVRFPSFDFSAFIPYLEGRANLQTQVSWPGLDWKEMDGTGRLSYRAVARLDQVGSGLLKALPLEGRSSLRMSGSRIQLPDAQASGESTQIDFQAQVDLASLNYAIAFQVREEEANRLLAALFEAIGEPLPQAVRQGLSVQGALLSRGDLKGQARAFEVTGQIEECRLQWQQQPLGDFQSGYQIRKETLVLEGARLQGANLDIQASRIDLSSDDPKAGALDLVTRFDGLPLQPFHSLITELAGPDYKPQGRLSGPLRLKRSQQEAWKLEGELRIDEPTFEGQSLDWLQAQVALDDASLHLQSLSGGMGPGRLDGSLHIDIPNRRLQVQAKAERIPLESIAALQQRIALLGLADVKLKAEGGWDDPQIEAQLELDELAYEEYSLKQVHLTAQGDLRRLSFEARHQLFDSQLESSGELQLSPPWDVDAEVSLKSVPVAPYLALLANQNLSGLDGRVSGTVRLKGPLTDLQRFQLEADLSQVAIETAGYRLDNRGPLKAIWSEGKIEILPFSISGPESSIQLSGNLRIAEPRSVQLRLEGHTNLRILNDVIPSGVAWGEVELSVIVSGDWDSPRLIGTADVQRAFLFNPALPTPLADASGSFKFSPSLISIDRFSASTNYGRVQALGSVFLQGFEPQRWKINLFGTGLKVEFPSDVFSTVDADIDLLKSDSGQLVTGTVRVLSSEYSKQLSLTDLFTQYMSRGPDVLYEGPAREMALDISVEGLRTLVIRNNLADLEASASLNVRGTVGNPVILGSLQIDEGKLFLEDNEYEINRGTINFNDPRRTNPYLNFEAETTVRDFVITATVQGTLDRPNIRFRSDPPLPTGDIVSLLAVGETMSELTGPSGNVSPGGLGVAAASRVLSRALQDSLEGQTTRLFGLQKFSVDPFVAGAGRDPGARITIGRQLGKNVAVSYITDLGSENSGQIVIVEVQLQSWLTAVGTREEDGSLAIDFKLKKRF